MTVIKEHFGYPNLVFGLPNQLKDVDLIPFRRRFSDWNLEVSESRTGYAAVISMYFGYPNLAFGILNQRKVARVGLYLWFVRISESTFDISNLRESAADWNFRISESRVRETESSNFIKFGKPNLAFGIPNL